jgi:hypothetical protein
MIHHYLSNLYMFQSHLEWQHKWMLQFLILFPDIGCIVYRHVILRTAIQSMQCSNVLIAVCIFCSLYINASCRLLEFNLRQGWEFLCLQHYIQIIARAHSVSEGVLGLMYLGNKFTAHFIPVLILYHNSPLHLHEFLLTCVTTLTSLPSYVRYIEVQYIL